MKCHCPTVLLFVCSFNIRPILWSVYSAFSLRTVAVNTAVSVVVNVWWSLCPYVTMHTPTVWCRAYKFHTIKTSWWS